MPCYIMQRYWYDTISNTLPNEVYKVFMFGHYRNMKNPALKELLPSNSVLPFFSIAETISLSSSGEDKNRKKRTYLFSSCNLHCTIFSTETGIKLMCLETLILHFVSDWTQHHKGKWPYCNALLNESYHTHSRLLTINSEQDWLKSPAALWLGPRSPPIFQQVQDRMDCWVHFPHCGSHYFSPGCKIKIKKKDIRTMGDGTKI